MNEERRNQQVAEEDEIDLVEVYYTLVKNIGNIIRVTLVFIIGAGIYLCFAKPVYESSSKLRIKIPKGIASSMLEQNGNIASRQLMSTYAEILTSRSVVEEVIVKTQQPDKEGKLPSYESYSGLITTTPVKDTEIMKVTVKANDPVMAQKANDVLLETFINRLTKLSQEEQQRKRMFLEESLRDLQKEAQVQGTNVSRELINTLSKRVEEARVVESAVAMEVQIVDKADLPTRKVAPKRTMIMAIAALAGALLGAAVVVLRSMFNRTIKSSDDMEKYLGIPCLGQVPDFASMQKNMSKENSGGILRKLKGVLWK